jgi:hypothetical protein
MDGNSPAKTYSTRKGNAKISVEDITKTYKYEKGVKYNRSVKDGKGESDYWLNNMSDRPVIQCKVVFTDLKPDTVYWYRIESEGVLDEDKKTLRNLVLAEAVYFKTAPALSLRKKRKGPYEKISFLAMGDFGPGNSQDSYFYDVFDLFHRIARETAPDLWLALGDIDNDTDGHPNAMDPFFFNVYNAYHAKKNPRRTSHTKKAKKTNVEAFKDPPYYGLLGGLPVYPTFGNHDICTNNDSSLDYFKKAYMGSFELPSNSTAWSNPAKDFNSSGRCKTSGCQFFYTFRYGDVIFISLGIPQKDCNLGKGQPSWNKKCWNIQKDAVKKYLKAIKSEIKKKRVWVVVYFHDHNYGLAKDSIYKEYRDIFLKGGVDLVLTGHRHKFKTKYVYRNRWSSYHVVVVGTGGFGDWYPFGIGASPCHRPGFILVEAKGDVLKYWKYDTHNCDSGGKPKGRGDLNPRIKDFCKITKGGLGKHTYQAWKGLNISV